MRRRYMDAMSLVQRYGKPDIFLTMTCNPSWPEIKKHLADEDEIQNRPDLVSRVFRVKIEQLKDDLFKKNLFGEVAAYTYVIKFQKRGLSHAHFLIILKQRSKMFSLEAYDRIVSAELPDPKESPYLHSLVLKHMVHGPCGVLNPNCPLKYIYKYIYKGHDKVMYQITSQQTENIIDEIRNFQSARWICAPESMWRIFAFDLTNIHPSVMTMHLHLQNHQSISFAENQTLDDVPANERNSRTMLTEFFSMNRTNKRAQDLNCLYKEFPKYFTWDEGDRIWMDRKRGEVIGRVNTAHPIEGERYYLRMLLMHVIKPTSFDDLKCVDGYISSTYKEAAKVRGLLQVNNGFDECLSEALVYNMPNSCTKDIETEYQIPVSDEDLASVSMLNKAQKSAFDRITEKLNRNIPGVFFIDGPGGTGKSFLYKALLATVRSRGHIALATATSSAAASLLPGGQTAHSRFKIPFHQDNSQTCNISKQSSIGKLLKLAKLIIWDETAMARKHAIESFDTMLRDILDSDVIFGGKTIVFGGDF
nr:uncharacterized protein LOC113718280 [Coffea arabica]